MLRYASDDRYGAFACGTCGASYEIDRQQKTGTYTDINGQSDITDITDLR
jgi:hypothetical protein